MRNIRFLIVAGLLALSAAAATAAEPINTLDKGLLFGYDATGVAIRGYDTVAYFTDGKPTPGSDAYTSEWQGATWKFASQAHLDLFEAEPERYAPQYGGYCAYGVAQDALVKIEPDQWAIIDGKLYLNYDADVQARWRQDTAGFIEQADKKFPALLQAD